MLGWKLNHVSKRGPCYKHSILNTVSLASRVFVITTWEILNFFFLFLYFCFVLFFFYEQGEVGKAVAADIYHIFKNGPPKYNIVENFQTTHTCACVTCLVFVYRPLFRFKMDFILRHSFVINRYQLSHHAIFARVWYTAVKIVSRVLRI